MSKSVAWSTLGIVVFAVGCGGTSAPSSAPTVDAAVAAVDAQQLANEAAVDDAAVAATDGVVVDTATTAEAAIDAAADTSNTDETGDGAALAAMSPAAPCPGSATDVYAAQTDLPPMSDATRGDIVACTSDGTLDVATVQTQLVGEGDLGVTATSAVAIYRIEFRTTRGDGSASLSSARVYLPASPIASVPPVIVAAHGTEGLASSCTTSMNATTMRELALPWAALGYPVIAPDYAGLGTPGVQGYEDNRDTAESVIDSVAALRKFVATKLDEKVVIDGHSQGAGASLAVQSLARTSQLQGKLAAVLAFAPEYYSHLDALGYIDALDSIATSDPLTIMTGVTQCTVAVMLEYSYFANHVAVTSAGNGFPSAKATELGSSIESLCTVDLGGAVQAIAPYVHDWIDPTLRTSLLACVSSHGSDPGCTGTGADFYAFLEQNILPPDPMGAPILIVQGLDDIVMPPAQEAACTVAQFEVDGVTPTVCTDATASHTNVVERNIAFGISWAEAILAGTTPPACAASALPACTQP